MTDPQHPAITPLSPGDPRALGRYRLLGRLGSGGMGEVFVGLSPGNRPVAIKVIHSHLARDPDFRRRFDREVRAARAVGGFHTAAVVDADPTGPAPWMATEFIPAPPLDQVIHRHGPLPAASVAVLARALAEALHAIHAAGVVHRDLKPSNVLVAADGPRVIDFGIARSVLGDGTTAPGEILGSPGYMSPEHARGGHVGPAGDMFALGGVLLFAAAGHGPYGQGSGAALLMRATTGSPDLSGLPPGRLGQLIAQCLSPDPADRPRPADLLTALGPATDDSGRDWLPPAAAADARQVTHVLKDFTTGAADAPPRRRRTLVRVALALALTVLAVASVVVAVTVADRPGDHGPAAAAPSDDRAPATISAGYNVISSVALSADGGQLFVVGNATVMFVDTKTDTVVHHVDDESRNLLHAIVSPDGRRVYRLSAYPTTVQVLDVATGAQLADLGRSQNSALALSPDGRLLYRNDGNALVTVDTTTNSPVGQPIPIGSDVTAIRPSPDGRKLYVTRAGSAVGPDDSAVVVYTASATVTSLHVAGAARSLALSPDGRRAAVISADNDTVTLLDTTTDAVTGIVRTGGQPTAVALSPNGSRAYVTSGTTATVLVIDTMTNTVVDNILVGREPRAVTVSGTGRLYVACEDDATRPVIQSLPLGTH